MLAAGFTRSLHGRGCVNAPIPGTLPHMQPAARKEEVDERDEKDEMDEENERDENDEENKRDD